MVAYVACDVWKRILLIDDIQSLCIASLANKAYVVRDVLMYWTGLHARRDIAVEKRKRIRNLGLRISTESLLGILHGACLFAKLLDRFWIYVLAVPRLALLFQELRHPRHPCVSTWLEHVGGQRDGPYACIEYVLDGIDRAPTGIRNRKLAVELRTELCSHLGGDWKKRPTRHIPLVAGKHLAVVDVAKGVRKLDAKAKAFLLGKVHQAVQHCNGIGILEVVLKALSLEDDMSKADVVEDGPYFIVSKKRWVELDERVEVLLREHVGTYGLDLLWRAAVHGGDRDALADDGAYPLLYASKCLGMAFQIRAAEKLVVIHHGLEGCLVLCKERAARCIHHVVYICLHLWLLDSFKVVANAHVEYEVRVGCLSCKSGLDCVDGEPSLEVLVESLLKGVLGGPLYVVAFVACVYARLCNLQVVHNLNRLELHEPAAHEVCAYDVLCKLRMRTCRRAKRCGALLAKDFDRMLCGRLVEIVLAYSKYGAMVPVLGKNPFHQFLKWNGSHSVSHEKLSY